MRSETEPLVIQFIYVFHDHDTFIVALICVIYHCYVLLLLQLLILHHNWYFVFISYHVQLRLLFLFNICSASFFFVVFTLINKHDTFQWLLRYVHTHARTRTHARTHAHAHTHAHARARTHTHAHARARTRTHAHARTRTLRYIK